MHRSLRQSLSSLAPVCLAAFAFTACQSGSVAAAPSPAPAVVQKDSKIQTQKVTDSIYMLVGRGGNLGVSVGEDGLLMIDDKFANLAPDIKEALAALAKDAGLDSADPRFLVNTHHHGDHTGGNAEFGADSTIIAQSNVRKRLADPAARRTMPKVGLPIVTFDHGLSVHFNGEEIRLMHLAAGHTDGDTVVLFMDSNVVHMGDLCFNHLFPYIDTASGGTVAGYIQNIEHVLESTNETTQYIPGHGPLATRANIIELRDMLKGVVKLVQEAHAAGQTPAEMKAGKLLAPYESWNWNFITADKMIDTVAGEFAKR
ncbi:MAG: MBL fold metallo-hydrolase [Planctomycetota bacterium]|nr:MBL fold metallo-hydrolase [Planctomycetota bacterium]